MFETKTIDDILLEERIAKIDDINFDKIYDLDEFAEKQIEENNADVNFSEQEEDYKEEISLKEKINENSSNDNAFEMEIQTNEFLDNFVWEDKEEKLDSKKANKNVFDKLLLFTFTSIVALLSILLVYNVFVINSLTANLKDAQRLKVQNAYSISNDYEAENNYISFENSSKIEIEKFF